MLIVFHKNIQIQVEKMGIKYVPYSFLTEIFQYNMLEKRQDIIEKLIFSFDSESNVEICYLAHICEEYELY